MASRGLIIGIDAANLRSGGGVTHLVELLNAATPASQGIDRVVVWTGPTTAARLPSRPWLEVVTPHALDGGLLSRTFWQWRGLPRAARARRCDVIFAPGGSYSADFAPAVTMSQNLLPFEWRELSRYGLSMMTAKLCLLRLVQSRSFRRSQGVLFLSDYAQRTVVAVTGTLKGHTKKIPHGIAERFLIAPRAQHGDGRSPNTPLRLLYVSIIDVYKHQWAVVEAVHSLRSQGIALELDLIGPAYPSALSRLEETVNRLDPEGLWVRYQGAVPYEQLHEAYGNADIAIFASSCENQPIILLEMMAAGLPIASSNRGPMPEILGDAGVYFDPERPADIAGRLEELVISPDLRARLAQRSFETARQFSWARTADETFTFLASMGPKVS